MDGQVNFETSASRFFFYISISQKNPKHLDTRKNLKGTIIWTTWFEAADVMSTSVDPDQTVTSVWND